MSHKILLSQLGFTLKENVAGVFEKKYDDDYYCTDVDVEKQIFYFGR
jgi:hypothetical protein